MARKIKYMYCVNCWYREQGDGSICKLCKDGSMWMHYETKEKRKRKC